MNGATKGTRWGKKLDGRINYIKIVLCSIARLLRSLKNVYICFQKFYVPPKQCKISQGNAKHLQVQKILKYFFKMPVFLYTPLRGSVVIY